MTNKSGMLPLECGVMDALVTAWENYVNLMERHPEDNHADDIDQFRNGIHICQERLAARVLRRDYPAYWSGRWRPPVKSLQCED
jgi:hypothetical protein